MRCGSDFVEIIKLGGFDKRLTLFHGRVIVWSGRRAGNLRQSETLPTIEGGRYGWGYFID
jgi:hypothetical protein